MAMTWIKRTTTVFVTVACAAAAGCGDVVRQGRAPVQLVITALQAAAGADPEEFGGTLLSDVLTFVERSVGGQQTQVATIFNDLGSVTMSLLLKDPGQPGTTVAPSAINQVTVTRYRVV